MYYLDLLFEFRMCEHLALHVPHKMDMTTQDKTEVSMFSLQTL